MIALKADGPKTAVIKIAIINEGKANTKSFPRIIKSSSQWPWFAAAHKPKGTPRAIPIPTATTATAIEVRAPTIIIEKISLPKWSVPNHWAAEGNLNLAVICKISTSAGVQTNDTSAPRRNMANNIPPKINVRGKLVIFFSIVGQPQHRLDQQ